MINKKALVIFSGGLDSAVALYWAKKQFKEVIALNFAYGSNHQKYECKMAKKTAKKLNIKLIHISLPFVKKYFKSELLGGVIPDGEYQEENMNSTIVPFRNGIMLSIATGVANSFDCDVVILGNHAGDHFIYPDCRPDFIKAMNEAIKKGTNNAVQIVSPFCNLNKIDIVKKGKQLNVDFSCTYSCYKGKGFHCGTCGTCVERKEAFKKAKVKDPTKYLIK